MISPFVSKLAASRNAIFIAAALWTAALVFIARGSAMLRQHDRHISTQVELPPDDTNLQLQSVQQENDRLQKDLAKLPELRDKAAQLEKEIAAGTNRDSALWAAHSNALSVAIDGEKQGLADIARWSAEWQKAEQVKAAETRLAEKARESSADHDQTYAQMQETLSKLALARKRLDDVRKEWRTLDKHEKEKFRSRLEEAQSEWMNANNALGKDAPLYQAFTLTNAADPSTVLLMRSVLPDQNGVSVSVYLDGTVQFSTNR